MRKNVFLSVVFISLILMVVGCDTVLNPLTNVNEGSGISGLPGLGGLMPLEPGPSLDIQIELPDFIQQEGTQNLRAPASDGYRLYVESNLFKEADYPAGTQVYEITGGQKSLTMRTVVQGWMRVYREPGGTIYRIRMKGPGDNYFVEPQWTDQNGAYLLMIDLQGRVRFIKPETPQNLVHLSFTLRTNVPADSLIYLSSHATSWQPTLLVLDSQTVNQPYQSWRWETVYPGGSVLEAVVWSTKPPRQLYTEGVYVNATELHHLVEIDKDTFHFGFELKENGVIVNTGTDNRYAAVVFN